MTIYIVVFCSRYKGGHGQSARNVGSIFIVGWCKCWR